MAFIDECKILFKAGNGGNGIVAWRREAHVPLGGPAGGNGGNGGSIILVGDHNENSLQNLKYLKHISAKNGDNGQIKTMHGKNADDVLVKVPVGTAVYNANTNELICDIEHDGQQFVICHGGKGGYGNFHFKSGYNKAPSLYELGDLGEVKECKLVLKHIADIGIVGLPNAGKSSFISAISAAKPKTANYQFTTLVPVLGAVYYHDYRMIFADIPGLIEGASEGVGLGHNFLKHIERTSVLVHLISMDTMDNQNPYDAYLTIMDELKKYSPELLTKPMIVVANKMDVDDSEIQYKFLCEKLHPTPVYKISAINHENLDEIIKLCYELLLKQKQQKGNEPKIINYSAKLNIEDELDKTLKINKIDDHTWNVECDYIKYWAHKIPLNTQDNIIRFNQKMKSAQVEETLKSIGAQKGDIIKMYNVEMVVDN